MAKKLTEAVNGNGSHGGDDKPAIDTSQLIQDIDTSMAHGEKVASTNQSKGAFDKTLKERYDMLRESGADQVNEKRSSKRAVRDLEKTH